MIIWFKGISGVGKTTIAKAFYKSKKKQIKNMIFVDGDDFRKLFRNDLGYSLQDRNKNAERLCSFIKYLNNQKINMIISANLTSKKYRVWAKRNLKDYLSIYISSNLRNLILRDKKKIYKKNKNIVGIQIKHKTSDNSDLYIENNSSKIKLLKNLKIINGLIKKKKIKIY